MPAKRVRLSPDQRRAAILSSAAETFASLPYPHVTIAAIATKAGVSDALLYRYFSGKEDLYTTVLREVIDALLAQQTAALSHLPPSASARDRLALVTNVYLDHLASHRHAWALPLVRPGSEPSEATALRAQARADYVERLRTMLALCWRPRQVFAIWGYVGFLDTACLQWVERGCPVSERQDLLDATLGSLDGALGK